MLDQKNKLPQLAPEPTPEPEVEVPIPKEQEVFKMPHKSQNPEETENYTTTPNIPIPQKPKKKKNCSPQLLEHLKKAREKSLATRKRNKELKLQAKKNLKAKEKEEINKLKMEIAEEPLKEPEQKIEMDENRRIVDDVAVIKEKPKEYKNTHNSEMIDYDKIIMGVSDRLLSQLDEVPEPSKPIPIPQEPKMEKILRGTPTFTPEHPQQYEQHIRQQERDSARDYYEKLYNDKNNKAIATNVVSRNSSYPRLNKNTAYSDDIWEKCFRN